MEAHLFRWLAAAKNLFLILNIIQRLRRGCITLLMSVRAAFYSNLLNFHARMSVFVGG